jgi:GAF domain-containing protein
MTYVESVTPLATATMAARRGRLGPVLSAIARTVAESLELKDVFSRVAASAREVLPFDRMGVNVAEDPDLGLDKAPPESFPFSAYAFVGDGGGDEAGRQYHVSDVSPCLRLTEIGKVLRMADVTTQLDTSFDVDCQFKDFGARSLIATLLPGPKALGSIWFASSGIGVFRPEDETTVLAIADVVALALQHERLFRKERQRRRRSEALEALVPALSRALDIREVFDQLSAAVAGILPHDRMALGLFSEDRKSVRIHAYTGERVPGMPETLPLDDASSSDWSFVLVRDLRDDPQCVGAKYDLMRQNELR